MNTGTQVKITWGRNKDQVGVVKSYNEEKNSVYVVFGRIYVTDTLFSRDGSWQEDGYWSNVNDVIVV